MAQVELRNIKARYGDVIAIDDVSLEIPAGSFVTLLGPSGCGKSSTLRVVAGLMKPNSGSVLFDGKDVTDLGPAKRNIGMVFQSLALFPHMTVAENVAFGLKMRKVAVVDQKRRVERTLEIVRLSQFASRYPRQLSGGQQQRVALARALVTEPSILILDEPFGALDRKLREAMQVELHALTRELGITALFVTHDQEEALMLSDTIAVMNSGGVEQFARPHEIYQNPATQFVADFMGMTNFLSCKLVDSNQANARVEVDGVVINSPDHPGGVPGQAITLAIRPEKMTIFRSEPSATKDAPFVAGRLRQVTYHGNASRYVVELESGQTLVALDTSGRHPDDQVLDSPVWVSWRTEDVHIFAN